MVKMAIVSKEIFAKIFHLFLWNFFGFDIKVQYMVLFKILRRHILYQYSVTLLWVIHKDMGDSAG